MRFVLPRLLQRRLKQVADGFKCLLISLKGSYFRARKPEIFKNFIYALDKALYPALNLHRQTAVLSDKLLYGLLIKHIKHALGNDFRLYVLLSITLIELFKLLHSALIVIVFAFFELAYDIFAQLACGR